MRLTCQFFRYFFLLLALHSVVFANNNQKKELTFVTQQIQSLKQTISTNQTTQLNLQQQLQATELTVGKLSEQSKTLALSLAKEQQTLKALTQEKTLLVTKLNNQYQALIAQLRMTYTLNTTQQWEILLNQRNITETSRHLMYYRYLTDARVKIINSIKLTLKNLNTTIQQLEKHQKALEKLALQNNLQKNQQQLTLKQREGLIQQLNNETKTKQKQLEVLLSNQKNLQETIARLENTPIAVSHQPFNTLRNQLNWPVKGTIIGSFGSRLDIGDQKLSGVLIRTNPGASVATIESGKVIFSNWLRGFGLLVIINHGDNYMSLYGRNQTLLVKTGDIVKKGDIIATAGMSGGFKETSLYFEIRHNGNPENPANWCRP